VIISLTACSGVGMGDQFDYITKQDEFSGAKITEASASVMGDVDKNASLTVVLRCKYPASEQPDPFKHTTIEFSLVDPKGDPKDFSDLTVKFDDTPPTNARFLEQNDTSKYSNVSEQYYSNMAVVMVPAEERVRALYARNQENAYRLINLAIHARSIMVRYETAGGMVNTNTLSIDGANYRKVLEGCGWQKWVKNYEETRAQATGIASPAPAPSTVAANAPANQSNGIPANRLADGVWNCTVSGEKFAIQITDHRRDTKAISAGTAPYGFAENANYRVIRGDRTSGKATVGLGCPANDPDCAGSDRIPQWSFEFAGGYSFIEGVDPKTGRRMLSSTDGPEGDDICIHSDPSS
jgi:hypothetical protein